MSGPQKTAIVIGASQGIGAGIVKGLSNGVFNVVANSRKVTQSTEVAASNHVALVDGHIGKPATAAKIVETTLFKSPAFTAASIALILYFCGFSIFLLRSALFMQDVWHFSALYAGVGIAPAPILLSSLRSALAQSSDASGTCRQQSLARWQWPSPRCIGSSACTLNQRTGQKCFLLL